MKTLKQIWWALSLPFLILLYLILNKVKSGGVPDKKSKAERQYLLHQTVSAWFMVAFYAVVFLAAFHASDWTLSFFGQIVSYVLNIWSLPAWSIEHQGAIALFSALIALLHVFKKTFRNFTISVPEYAGVLTVNYFGGRFEKYGQGLHLKLPQERFDLKLCFSLEFVTVNFEEDYVTSDRGIAIVEGSFRYAPSFERLEAYAAVDERTLGSALLNIAKSDLTVNISKRTTDEARAQTEVIKQAIDLKYKGIAPIESELGFDFKDFTIADIGFEKETQKAMTASFAAKLMFAGLEDNPQAREDVLALAGGKIEKKVNQWRLDRELKGLQDIAPAILAALTAWNARPNTTPTKS